jgi:predicted alpha/beta-fold hydrolase
MQRQKRFQVSVQCSLLDSLTNGIQFGLHRLHSGETRRNLSTLETSLDGLTTDDQHNEDPEQEYGDENADLVGPLGLNQLSSPLEPFVELVFVHGLGGGSRKSWSYSHHEDHFWPRSWLARDPDFRHVRTYSFGYQSAKSEVVSTISGIPDIAQSLLSALRDNTAVRQSQNAIVLVGHSMGGLVIKKVSSNTIEEACSTVTGTRARTRLRCTQGHCSSYT